MRTDYFKFPFVIYMYCVFPYVGSRSEYISFAPGGDITVFIKSMSTAEMGEKINIF